MELFYILILALIATHLAFAKDKPRVKRRRDERNYFDWH